MEMDARVFCIPRREGFVIILPTCLYWQQKGPNFKDGAGFIFGALFPILDSKKTPCFFGTNGLETSDENASQETQNCFV